MPIKFASARAKQPNVQYDYVPFKGGLDQLTPTLAAGPGIIRDSQNFEVSANKGGGYSRIAGYERFDGRPSPSDASYTLIQIASFTNVPTVGQTLTGGTSGATGVILAVAASYLILTKIVGTFTTSEAVTVGATPIGTTTPITTNLNQKTHAQYTQLAADNYRADIGAVPGAQAILGVVAMVVNSVDVVYAFRNNAGSTNVEIYKSTTGGWVLVPFYNEVSFTAGGVATPGDGATLSQGGNTAIVKRIVLESGSWAAGTAAGRFIVVTPAPGNFAAGAATVNGIAVTLSGAQTAITRPAGGKFEFEVGTFSGQVTSTKIYGCDGVGYGFEFDGDVYVPIHTGAAIDNPKHVKIHRNQLFWSYGSSVIHSAVGFPYKYAALDGASEIAVGDTVTNFITQPGSNSGPSLVITTENKTFVLYGTSAATWNLVQMSQGVGGVGYTAQTLNQAYWLDKPGVVNLYTTQNFGDFAQSTITENIPNVIAEHSTDLVVGVVNRAKSQYRLLYGNSAFGLYITIVNGKVLGMATVKFAEGMYSAWNSTTVNGVERIYCGSIDSGYVYRMDVGSSFDGEAIPAYLTLNWNATRSPRVIKRYRRASLEITGNFYAAVSFGYALGYNTSDLVQPQNTEYETGFGGVAHWDEVFWDAFTWDGSTVLPTEVQLRGSAVNIQPYISSTTNYIMPFTISSMMLHYTARRGVR